MDPGHRKFGLRTSQVETSQGDQRCLESGEYSERESSHVAVARQVATRSTMSVSAC